MHTCGFLEVYSLAEFIYNTRIAAPAVENTENIKKELYNHHAPREERTKSIALFSCDHQGAIPTFSYIYTSTAIVASAIHDSTPIFFIDSYIFKVYEKWRRKRRDQCIILVRGSVYLYINTIHTPQLAYIYILIYRLGIDCRERLLGFFFVPRRLFRRSDSLFSIQPTDCLLHKYYCTRRRVIGLRILVIVREILSHRSI